MKLSVAGKLTIVSKFKTQCHTKEFSVHDKCIFNAKSPKNLAKTLDYWIEHPKEKGRMCEENILLHQKSLIETTAFMSKTRDILLNAAKTKNPNSY